MKQIFPESNLKEVWNLINLCCPHYKKSKTISSAALTPATRCYLSHIDLTVEQLAEKCKSCKILPQKITS